MPTAIEFGVAFNNLRVRDHLKLDLETTGLDPRQDTVLLVGIDEYVFPGHMMSSLAPLIENPKIQKVNFNWAFDGMFWQAKGIHPVNLRDPMLGCFLLKVGLPYEKGDFSLGNLLEKCLGVRHDKTLQTSFVGVDPAEWWAAGGPTYEQLEYLYRDVQDLKRLDDWAVERLEEQGLMKTYQLECAYSQVIAEMQLNGLWVDVAKYRPVVEANRKRLEEVTRQLQEALTPAVMEARLKRFEQEQTVRLDWEALYERLTTAAERELDAACPNLSKAGRRKRIQEVQREFRVTNPRPGLPKMVQTPINVNSDLQIKEALAELGLPLADTQKTTIARAKLGAPPEARELLDLLIEHSALTKLDSTYGEGLIAAVEDDGRVRSRFQQIVNTGRISSSKWKDDVRGVEKGANLQNPHKDFKACVRPAPGNAYVIYDLAAIELRVLADRVLEASPNTADAIAVAILNGLDPHSLTVERVFGIPYAKVEAGKDSDPEVGRKRHACKTTNFSAVFDVGPEALAMRIHAETKDTRPLGQQQVLEAKNFLKGMWQANPDANSLLKIYEYTAVSNGYMETVGGRRRYFTRVQPNTPQYFSLLGSIKRQARNVPIQGTAADILKLAQALIQRRFWRAGIRWFIANAMHDEIVTEGPEQHKEQADEIVAGAMKEAFEFYLKHVPYKASGGIAHAWTH